LGNGRIEAHLANGIADVGLRRCHVQTYISCLREPDHVDIVMHDYRWRLGLADGERKYDDLEMWSRSDVTDQELFCRRERPMSHGSDEIVIAEDNAVLLSVLAEIFKVCGYSVSPGSLLALISL
jgi:hypothetical protein